MTCRRAAGLISRQLDADLPPHLRAGLGLHVLLCGACRRFRRQLREIDTAVEELVVATAARGGAELPPATKMHLLAVVVARLDGER